MSVVPDAHDVQLRDGLIAGSEHALAEVYDTYGPVVYGMALQVTRDRGAAEDIVQEALAKGFVAIRNGDMPDKTEPWLFRIAHNAALDFLRKRARARGRESEIELDTIAEYVGRAFGSVAEQKGIEFAIETTDDAPQSIEQVEGQDRTGRRWRAGGRRRLPARLA